LEKNHPENKFFDTTSLHLHVPEGAIKKDGPSAGCTLTSSLLSLAMDKPLIPDLAMTGEITLTGRILKIGGVKEKLIAAKRVGVKKVIVPESNRSDVEDLEDYVKEGIEIYFVNWYEDISKIIFEK
jgi:ATP-dependent Lon protease